MPHNQLETVAPAGGTVPVQALQAYLQALFAATGLGVGAAQRMAAALVEADQQGLGSHGVSQAHVYLERLRRGSVTTAESATVALDGGAFAVLDAGNMLGHLAGDQAMQLAIDKAAVHGVGVIAMRGGLHFGVSGRYAVQAARQGCVGMVMCNATPVMPAPGGLDPLVGTNPLAIALPTGQEPAFLLDMATSEGGIAKIRVAARRGEAIPGNWAVNSRGEATTDPAEALAGMLLPTGGPKGFALSFIIDLLCGLLSSGGWGSAVTGLHRDLDLPYNGSSLFISLDVQKFRPNGDFAAEAEQARARLLQSRALPGVRLRTPGQAPWEKAQQQQTHVAVDPAVLAGLARLAIELGVAPFGASP
jgi:LDH2 family malate/lactate/ureidoglycolate dehydrogenase